MSNIRRRRFSLFPKPLARVMEPLTKPLFKARGLAGSRLVGEWRQVVGDDLAAHCWPEKLGFPQGKKSGGTLTIAAESAFALELQHMQPLILERVNGYYGYPAVARLSFIHRAARPKTPVPAPSAGISARTVKGIAPVTGVDDPDLKNALQSLAKTLAGKYSP